jgi:hypothetical protein
VPSPPRARRSPSPLAARRWPLDSPLLAHVTGRYFEDNEEAKVVAGGPDAGHGVAAHAVDPTAADRLWTYAGKALAR